MARIEGVPASRAGLMVRFAYYLCRRMFGKVVEPMTITAHNPWIFRAYGGYEWAFAKANRVEPKLKVLAEIKAATMIGCPF